MEWNVVFFMNSLLLGVGLAMDAFSVSLANGMHDVKMRLGKMGLVAGVFGLFQGFMPLVGWICVHTIVEHFKSFEKLIPWIALILLCYIGGKMLWDGIHCEDEECENLRLTFGALMVQGIATSIDALSVGFTIAEYGFWMALVCALIIAVVTFFLCFGGLQLGKTFGTRFSGKSSVLGGVILILVGIEIFLTGIL